MCPGTISESQGSVTISGHTDPTFLNIAFCERFPDSLFWDLCQPRAAACWRTFWFKAVFPVSRMTSSGICWYSSRCLSNDTLREGRRCRHERIEATNDVTPAAGSTASYYDALSQLTLFSESPGSTISLEMSDQRRTLLCRALSIFIVSLRLVNGVCVVHRDRWRIGGTGISEPGLLLMAKSAPPLVALPTECFNGTLRSCVEIKAENRRHDACKSRETPDIRTQPNGGLVT